MPIGIAALKALAASGATADMIVAAVEAQQSVDDAALSEKRRMERDRKRAFRLSRGQRGQPGTTRDIADGTQAGAPKLNGRTSDSSSEEILPEADTNTSPILTSFLPSSSDSQEKKEGVVGRARSRGRGIRLPDDWSLSDDDIASARKVLPANRIEIEFEKFRDHWHASGRPNAVKCNWSAAWRNWCRTAVEIANGYAQHRGFGNNGHNSGSEPGSHAAKAVAAFRRSAGAFGQVD